MMELNMVHVSLETWLAYIAAYTVISLIPGPSVFMVIGQSLSRGLRTAMFCVIGDVAGGVVVMVTAYAGLGLILAASVEAFVIIKWAGAAYMLWLGVTQIAAAKKLKAEDLIADEGKKSSQRSASWRAGFLTGVLNPKAIMFYVAFLAQFMDPNAPPLPQFLTLMATSCGVVFGVLTGYALLAAFVRRKFQNLRARKAIGYVGGSFMLGGGAFVIAVR
jgi:threonine/homoserine/homoserine lactone efflux protein